MTKNETIYTIRRPNLKGIPRNKTTLFMLPSIGFKEEKTGMRLLKYYGFVNCYLSHTQSTETYTDCLILVFNPTSEALAQFKEFYNIYKTYPNFVDDYTIDLNVIAVVFRVLPRWLHAFKEFQNSRYSSMPQDYIDLFKRLDPVTGKLKATDAYYIMKKDSDYRRRLEESLEVRIDKNAELMSPLNEDEIFNYGITKIQPRTGQREATELRR